MACRNLAGTTTVIGDPYNKMLPVQYHKTIQIPAYSVCYFLPKPTFVTVRFYFYQTLDVAKCLEQSNIQL